MTVNTVIAGASTCTAPYAPTQQSFAATSFTAAGTITGQTTGRDENHRWADWVNVKEYGATGNGVTDDTTAIQLAFNSIPNQVANGSFAGQPVTTVYFPTGVYKLTSSITFMNNNGGKGIVIRGDGNGSSIIGNFADYMFKQTLNVGAAGPWSIENLAMANANTTANSGCILCMAGIGGSIRNCYFVGYNCVNFGAAVSGGGSAISSAIYNSVFTSSVGQGTGSFGASITNGQSMYNCDLNSFDHGIRMYNKGCQVLGGRIERCNTAIVLGMDDQGTTNQVSEFLLSSISMEANDVGVLVKACGDGLLVGISPSGSVGAPGGNSVIGLDIRGTGNIVCIGCGPGGSHTDAAIKGDAAGTGGDGQVTFIGCEPNNSSGSVWTGCYGASFIQCNQPNSISTGTLANANSISNKTIGMRVWVTDSNTTTMNAIVASGGGNTILAEWFGTNWRVASAGA